ncbi:MAG: NAD-dependent epimerase/dehydratase family protein, partial [Chloroflexota bacterium]|nr:NAD-dependent epimerase/dehydratase family protein [Chloroflexota bacterium]
MWTKWRSYAEPGLSDMTRALVVGGTGPSGTTIVERMLARGWQVSIYHTGAHEREFSRAIEHIHGDPGYASDLERDLTRRNFDVVVSTSGRIRSVVNSLKGRTRRLVAISGLPVYAGALAAPGAPGVPVPISEDAAKVETKEQDAFGYAVLEGERTVLDAHAAGHFQATILRYTMVYGPYASIPFDWYRVRRALDRRPRLVLEADG